MKALPRPSRLAELSLARYNLSVSPSVTKSIQVKVLFFGRLKEIAGFSEQVLEVGEGARIEALFAQCVHASPELSRYRSSLVASRNQEFCAWDSPLQPGDEIAFLPPVSGG